MSSQRHAPPTPARRGRRSHHRLPSFPDFKAKEDSPRGFETALAQTTASTGLELQLHQAGPPPNVESATSPLSFHHTLLEVTQTEGTKAHTEQRYLELTRLERLPDQQSPTQHSASPVLPSAELAAAFNTGVPNMAAPSPIYVILLSAPAAATAAAPQHVYMLTPTGLVPVPGGIAAALAPAPTAPALVLQLAPPAPPPPPTTALVLQLAPPAPPPPQPAIILQLAPPAPPPPPPPPAFMIACAAPAPAPPPAPIHVCYQ
ncbi:hypothetical protein B0T14DRAFT_566741 [Immersiella caudata]|uniref:Uncharacterized protein n=1 Tax=Immersiella caudata TaxID=314043 RepID=A0AA39WQX3_9PEZI|nr:hypothetical protein B0T14DRAFT_566741 [Immersiella caudata]